MKVFFLIICAFSLLPALSQRTLRDSLYGGKLKADTGKTFVSKDTSKYVILKNDNVSSSQPGDRTRPGSTSTGIIKPDESMPDSLNKLFYGKQRLWKKFIETNT